MSAGGRVSMARRVETFIERDALPLLIILLALCFAPGLPWILAEMAS